MIYTSILLVQCYSEQLGSVLTKLTYHAVHVSSEFNTFRDLIYKAYYNVTATKELGQLVEAFPSCYQWSKTVYNEDGGNITCSSQSSKVNSLVRQLIIIPSLHFYNYSYSLNVLLLSFSATT